VRLAWAICVALLLAAWVGIQSELRAEGLKLLTRPPSPNLVGPDPIEPAPVLAVSEDRMDLDGRVMTSDELEKTLRTLANNYRLLYPNETFNGTVVVACAPATSTRRLGDQLKRALAAGYPNVNLLLIRPDPAAPPNRSADQVTGALVSTSKREAATLLKIQDLPDCLSLAKAVVAQRNQKKAVFLDLGGGKKEARKVKARTRTDHQPE
jgi:hypothetical protein